MQRRIGIPTMFAGIQYRSRTEATWAAFFTELKLKFTYEPCDLDGYIPDFDVAFKKLPLLVEVKGSTEDIELAKLKLETSGWTGDAAIVVSGSTNMIGAMFDADYGWDNAALAVCLACKSPTICSESGRWRCRNCQAGAREIYWGFNPAPAWAAAQNITQWRAA